MYQPTPVSWAVATHHGLWFIFWPKPGEAYHNLPFWVNARNAYQAGHYQEKWAPAHYVEAGGPLPDSSSDLPNSSSPGSSCKKSENADMLFSSSSVTAARLERSRRDSGRVLEANELESSPSMTTPALSSTASTTNIGTYERICPVISSCPMFPLSRRYCSASP